MYYEGILQLRNPNGDIIDFFQGLMSKRPEVFISKTVKLDNGFDIYLSSKKYVRQIGKKLQLKFGGELVVSAEHFSRDRITSRDVFRVSVMYRHYTIKKGDIILFRGEKIKIIHVGKKLHAVNTSTGRRFFLEFRDIPKHNIFQDGRYT